MRKTLVATQLKSAHSDQLQLLSQAKENCQPFSQLQENENAHFGHPVTPLLSLELQPHLRAGNQKHSVKALVNLYTLM